jgi:hypothetical protein
VCEDAGPGRPPRGAGGDVCGRLRGAAWSAGAENLSLLAALDRYLRRVTDIPAEVSTQHGVEFYGDRVVKTFRAWDGGQHLREWRGLRLLHQFAPGLAPQPLRAEFDTEPPRIVMSRVPGEPLGIRPATSQQVDALVAAIEMMHRCVPGDAVGAAGPQDDPADIAGYLRTMLASLVRPTDGVAPVVRTAFDAAAEIVGSDWARDAASIGQPSPVLGLCDNNLANFLWDGEAVHIVDFESARGYDRAYDIADLVEHISVRWTLSAPSPWESVADGLLDRFDLRSDERARVRAYRPVFAAFWLFKLLSGLPADRRRPQGILEDQAGRLLAVR